MKRSTPSADSAGRSRPAPDARLVVFLFLWIALLALGPTRMLQDPGAFWHTVVGERMLTEGHVVSTDSFSFTHEGDEWLAQQWLGECAMALVHRVAGLDGVILLAATIIAAIFTVIFGRFAKSGPPLPMCVVATIIAIGASSYHFIPRPHLATLAGMTLLTLILLDVESGRISQTRLWILPPMFVLWANTHGGVLGGLATLLIFAMAWLLCPRFLRQPSRIDRSGASNDADLADTIPFAKPRAPLLATIVGLATISILVNPFGPALPRVWISLMGSSVIPKVIIEHARLAPFSPEGGMILLLAAVYFFLLNNVRRRGLRVAWLLPAIWFPLALSRVRHGPIFAIVTALTVADMLPYAPACRKWLDAIGPLKSAPRRRPGAWPFAVAVIVLFAAALGIQAAGWRIPLIGAGRCAPTNAIWPVKAVAVLDSDLGNASRSAHVFNEMRFGGYLAYAAPAAKIYIDDRCELYRDEGLLRYIELQRRPERIPGEAARYRFDYALVRTGSPVCTFLKTSGAWSLMHSDATATLLKSTAESSASCAIAKHQPHG
ncbi:MAG TPA: hypothetical protein P5081_12495 [Phycisphaerae bacterium]|nr:hypothetical protein [Phycisphaerae bacterium]HRW53696.1 hypothetical protein [Phycisphaerae bacterium]